MAVEYHTFDQDGDLLLIFSHPPDEQPISSSELEGTNGSSDIIVSSVSDESSQQSTTTSAELTTTSDVTAALNATAIEPVAAEHGKELVLKKPNIDVHMLVSSKHMMLASPVFKAMLQHGNFKEGQTLRSLGGAEVSLPDDDVASFIILLNIIHGKTRKVPRRLDLQLMTRISITVDKYQMQEAVELFSDVWFNDLKENLPTTYVNYGLSDEMSHETDVMSWLGISWVFRKPDEFKILSQMVERQGDDRLEEDIPEGIPIPGLIIEAIKSRRTQALSDAFALIEQTVKRYQRAEILCPRTDQQNLREACDAMLLGSLQKTAAVVGIWPPSTAPYEGVVFSSLSQNMRNLNVKCLCDEISRIRINGAYPAAAHGLKNVIEEKIVSLEERLCGLDIEEFLGRKKTEVEAQVK